MSDNKAIQKISSYLRSEVVKNRFAEVLGDRNAGAYISSVLLAVANDESGNLQRCDVESIYISALRAATLRLSVDSSTGQAYLVPFGGRATLIVGYKGLQDLAVRTNRYRYINIGKVYEGEIVTEDRITGFHKIEGSKKSDKVIGLIGAFELFSGFAKTVYMTLDEIHVHAQKYSKNYNNAKSQWKVNPEAMERKTVLRLMLRRWGYLDPADAATLDELEREEVVDIEPAAPEQEAEPEFEPEPDQEPNLDGEFPPTPEKQTEAQTLKDLGFDPEPEITSGEDTYRYNDAMITNTVARVSSLKITDVAAAVYRAVKAEKMPKLWTLTDADAFGRQLKEAAK